MTIRRTLDSDLPRVLACRVTEPISNASEETFRRNLATGSYRPEWTWIAEEENRIVARAVWWGLPEADQPLELDCLYVDPAVSDPIDLCGRLVAQSVREMQPTVDGFTYQLFLPVGWRSDEAVAAAVRWRLDAVVQAGLTEAVERLRYEWTPDCGIPCRSARLGFVAADDDAFVDVFQRVAVGSLDADTRHRVARLGEEESARRDLARYSLMPGSRDSWRLAKLNGEVVGFAIPSANDAGPVLGYLGVVPEQRGRGYSDDLVAEASAILIEQGATRIVADTDAGNTPMVAAFVRANYRNFAVRLTVRSPLA